MSKTLHPVWSDKHKAYMQAAKSATISVAEGAVRAGKTVDNVAVFAWMLDHGVPDRIHLATGSTSANAKLNIGDCNGFGLEYIFRGRCHWTKYKGNEALVILAHRRQYIVIFAGGGKADSFKKIRGNSYGMWIATEINLHHQSTIEEAFNRQLAAQVRRVFWDLNPSAPAAYIYKQHIDRFAEQYGARYNYQHFTIRDNLTISEERLADVEAQYDKNSVWYRRDILGERCSPEGLIYDMFRPDFHIIDTLPELEGPAYVSSDFGIQNATVFLQFQKKQGTNDWVICKEWYYSGREEHKQKDVEQLMDGLDDMVGERKPNDLIIDPSAAALIVAARKRGYHTRRGDNDVLPGISDVATMLATGHLFVHRSCTHTIEEFGAYIWDASAAENGEDVPVKDHDHCMDAVRYFVRTMKLVKKDRPQTGLNQFL